MPRHLLGSLIVLAVAAPTSWAAVGDVYVATPSSILRIAASTGLTTTFSTAVGSADGMAFDGSGGLFVSDLYNNRVVRFDANGTATTYASVNQPAGLAFDSAGDLFAVSRGDTAIYKITPDGTKSLFVNASAQGRIKSVALDPSGNVYFDSPDSIIYKATPTGVVSQYYTGLSSGTYNINALATDGSSALFVATQRHVLQVNAPGNPSYTYRSDPDQLGQLVSLAFDANHNLYAANVAKSVVEEFPSAGGYVTVGSNVQFASALAVQTVVPEPASLALLAGGGLLLRRRRR